MNRPRGCLARASAWVQPVGGWGAEREVRAPLLPGGLGLAASPPPRAPALTHSWAAAPGSRTCSLLQSHTGKVSTTARCLVNVISPQPHPHSFLLLVPTDSSHFPTLGVPSVLCWGGCEFLRTAVTNYHQLGGLEEQNFIFSNLSSPGVQ